MAWISILGDLHASSVLGHILGRRGQINETSWGTEIKLLATIPLSNRIPVYCCWLKEERHKMGRIGTRLGLNGLAKR